MRTQTHARLIFVWLALLLATSGGAAEPIRIVRIDPALDRLLPRDAKVERIAEGFVWIEGPVWHREGRYLLFSDVAQNKIFKWQEGAGVSVHLKPSGYTGAAPFTGPEPGSNGLALDREGRLIIAQHGDRRIVRVEADGTWTMLVATFEGKRLNSPNDLAFKSNGDLYFTDPPFGLPRTFDDESKEIPFSGVYRLAQDGTVTLLVRDLKAPNGVAFSPDEKTLYVTNADRERPQWLAYEVLSDGALGERRVLVDGARFAESRPGGPDGLKVDRAGNLFSAGPGGIYIFDRTGRHLGTIDLGVATGNCAWGDDGSVLYITAGTTLFRVRLDTQGAGF